MSLDVYLTKGETEASCECRCGHQHTRKQTETVFEANITHNLNNMAGEAGIYKALWRPENLGIVKAYQLIEPLQSGLNLLNSDPDRFKKFDAENGWGTYEQFVPWVEQYLEACKQNLDADVSVSR